MSVTGRLVLIYSPETEQALKVKKKIFASKNKNKTEVQGKGCLGYSGAMIDDKAFQLIIMSILIHLLKSNEHTFITHNCKLIINKTRLMSK